MPWDRHWAVTHDKSKVDPANPAWVMCRNFVIGSMNPGVAGIWATLDTASATITLRHADLGEITFAPDDPGDVNRFLAWAGPACADGIVPTGITTVPGRGMTDSDFASISIMTVASHTAVETQLGHPLERERWRGNIWIDGPEPWAEETWIGKTLRIGQAELAVREPIERCNHTRANPTTGRRDVDTLTALRDGWGHQNFGVYAEVTTGGTIAVGDRFEVL